MHPSCKNSRTYLALLCGLFALFLGGCLEQRLVWSPDGRRAAVLTDDGLCLSDADGKLSSVLVPDVHRVAWLPDSSRLVLATFREAGSWAEVERELTPQQKQVAESFAETAWQKLQAGAPWSEGTVGKKGEARGVVVAAYLRHRYGDAFLQKLSPKERDNGATWQVGILELKLAQVEGDKLVMGPVLHHGLGRCVDIRLSPDGQAAAFVVEQSLDKEDNHRLFVTTLAAPKSVELATLVMVFPDWTADSRSLAYIQAASAEGANNVPALGSVVLRRVRDAEGKLVTEPEPTVVAGVVVNGYGRVRCLRDGRIVFNATEISLPLAAADAGDTREQLFAIDPTRQATLTRLIPRRQEDKIPKVLGFFEVSPDERRILFGTYKGEVAVLTLETGEVAVIQAAGEDLQGAPQWRSADEFTYVRRNSPEKRTSSGRDGELVLRRGKEERVLSTAWPDDVVRPMF